MANNNNNDIYTEEERELLNRTLNYRLAMVTEVFKDGAPKRTGDIRVANEVLNSIDSAIDKAATTRLKQTAVKNDADMRATVIGIFKAQAERRSQQAVRKPEENQLAETPELVRPTFVPGEDSFEQPALTMEEIMGENDGKE